MKSAAGHLWWIIKRYNANGDKTRNGTQIGLVYMTPYGCESHSWVHCTETNSLFRELHIPLKALDTFGNCQRPVFSLGVPPAYYVNIRTQYWSSMWQENKMTEKHYCCTNLYAFGCLKWVLGIKSFNIWERIIIIFLKNYVHLEGADSHNVVW